MLRMLSGLLLQDAAELERRTFATSCLTQFRVLFIRTFMSIVRDTVSLFC